MPQHRDDPYSSHKNSKQRPSDGLFIMKDDKSFVSLGDTFKPDDAASLCTTETERNWNRVVTEAIALPCEPSDLPVAQAQAITIDEGCPPSTATAHVTVLPGQVDGPVNRCNLLTMVIGYSHLVFAVATAFATELAGATIYMVGAGFFWVSQRLKDVGVYTFPFQALFVILTAVMLALDLLLFFVGVLVVELIGWIAGGLCVLFGGISAGADWHQHIRKVCHLARWAFRGFHAEWELKRMRPWSGAIGRNGDGEEGDCTMDPAHPTKVGDVDTIVDQGVEKDKEVHYA